LRAPPPPPICTPELRPTPRRSVTGFSPTQFSEGSAAHWSHQSPTLNQLSSVMSVDATSPKVSPFDTVLILGFLPQNTSVPPGGLTPIPMTAIDSVILFSDRRSSFFPPAKERRPLSPLTSSLPLRNPPLNFYPIPPKILPWFRCTSVLVPLSGVPPFVQQSLVIITPPP